MSELVIYARRENRRESIGKDHLSEKPVLQPLALRALRNETSGVVEIDQTAGQTRLADAWSNSVYGYRCERFSTRMTGCSVADFTNGTGDSMFD